MLIGYVRVSTNDQNTALQRDALERSGCELIFEDKMSGKTAERPGLKKLLKRLYPGDTLVVWKLDRLGRSMRNLVILVEELKQRSVNFRSLTDSIDTSTPMGRFFFPHYGRAGGNGKGANRGAYSRRAGGSKGARSYWWQASKANPGAMGAGWAFAGRWRNTSACSVDLRCGFINVVQKIPCQSASLTMVSLCHE